jgi:lysophospholipase L1-like esterase
VALAAGASMLIVLLAPRRSRPPPRGSIPAVRLALVSIAWVVFALDWQASTHASRRATLDVLRPIVCLGDSLTADMPPAESYPTRLAPLVGPTVVNLGQPGISAQQALKQLPELIALRPLAVVIELGGHDYLHGRPRSDTRADLERIMAAARSVGSEVLLIEVPRGFIVDPYRGLERELARRHDLELISDSAIRQCVLRSPAAPPGTWLGPPYLSEDGLHPNSAGADLLAHDVAAALLRLFGPEVLRPPGKAP